MLETSARLCHVRLPRAPNELTAFANVPALGNRNLELSLASRLSSNNSLYAEFVVGIMLLHQIRCIARVHSPKPSVYPKPTRRTCSYAFPTPCQSSTRPRHASRADPARWHLVAQIRGAKTQTTLNIDDIPQGIVKAKPLSDQDDAEPEYPPLLQQVRNNMLKFSHCVVVTRVGGFYEV